MDDAQAWLKDDIDELTKEQKTRELLVKLGQAGYLNDEQYSAVMEMPEIREEAIGSIIEDLTLADLVQEKFSRKLIDLLDPSIRDSEPIYTQKQAYKLLTLYTKQ